MSNPVEHCKRVQLQSASLQINSANAAERMWRMADACTSDAARCTRSQKAGTPLSTCLFLGCCHGFGLLKLKNLEPVNTTARRVSFSVFFLQPYASILPAQVRSCCELAVSSLGKRNKISLLEVVPAHRHEPTPELPVDSQPVKLNKCKGELRAGGLGKSWSQCQTCDAHCSARCLPGCPLLIPHPTTPRL